MSTELVRADAVDSWAQMIGPVGELATRIAGTSFVPDSMRGDVAATAAAILTGRELGIGPMTALAHIHVIKGKPGLSAQLMRSLILSAGHKIRYVEQTDSRCVVEGRRADEQEWTRVTFTKDQAAKAKIDLGPYPEDKLVARATSRLARRIFADAIGGLSYTIEELEDGNPGGEAAPAASNGRKAQRATTPQRVTAERIDDVELPDEGMKESSRPRDETIDSPPLDDDHGVKISPAQTKMLMALFNECGYTDRDDRLRATVTIVGREVDTSNDLTKAEASRVIDTLAEAARSSDPQIALADALEILSGGPQ